ncbi:C40 family peptidase [Paenibacillus anseongensis]|uniref:C40 family peptidase n=1 Tax=Paenibacillus TaxID=44249 RepID=UPI001FE7DC54|nr:MULTISPECIES: NlpC/P60 family protein [Paenibacillus]
MRLRGTPYRFGAGPFSKLRRFDCSSYLQYIFGRNGINLPRTTRSQTTVGKRISQKDVEAGDVIFFRRPRYSDNRMVIVGLISEMAGCSIRINHLPA